MTEELRALRDRVAGLTGPCRDADRGVAIAFNIFQERGGTLYHWCEAGSTISLVYEDQLPRYTASIDAVDALRQRFLPGCAGHAVFGDLPACFIDYANGSALVSAPSEALARLLALLDVLIAQGEE